MKKNILIIVIVTVVVAVVAIGTIPSAAGNSLLYSAGQYLKQALSKNEISLNGSEILATYSGTPITATVVEYHKKMNILKTDDAVAEHDTDIEIINSIVRNMILFDEATRLGLIASNEEIDAMVNNTRNVYNHPDGKKMMDEYLQGAGLTLDEYLDNIREQAPRVIARQKLLDAYGKQYCQQNGLEFSKVNPPKEMVEAQDAYIQALFDANSSKIEYFIDIPVVE